MKFLSDIEVQAGIKDNSDSAGASGQVLSSTVNGVSWISPDAFSSESSEKTHIPVKNTSGATIEKGTPVYITGETGNSGKIEIAPADASDSAKMPAVGILEVALTDNSEGFCISGGLLEGLATETIDGTTTTANDTVYVKSGGGLTMTKPTGSDNLIQNIAKIARTHASNGSLIVSSILRTNDVPNLPEGRIWVGDGNTIVSDTVYVDEPNNRVGIGTDSPRSTLEVDGQVLISNTFPALDFVDTNSFTDPNDRFRVRAGGNQGLMQWYDDSSSSLLTLMTLNPNGDVIVPNGNVGIGTTSPQEKLHVSGGVGIFNVSDTWQQSSLGTHLFRGGAFTTSIGNESSALKIFPATNTRAVGNYWGGINFMQLDPENSGWGASYTGSQFWIGGRIIDTPGQERSALVFATNSLTTAGTHPTERMAILPDGNVGIGTTSPAQKLDVNGNLAINGTTFVDSTRRNIYLNSFAGGGANGIFFRDGFNYNASITAEDHSGSSADGICISGYDGVSFSTGSNAKNERMRIDVNGNVGIGTTSPWNIGAGYTGLTIDDTTTGFLALRTSGTTKLVLSANGNSYLNGGNVGIGTTSPAFKLDVSGSANNADVGIRINNTFDDNNAASEPNAVLFLNAASNNGYLRVHGAPANTVAKHQIDLGSGAGGSFLTFSPSGEKMRITNDGDVGIGTTSPSVKLDVNGTIKTNAIFRGDTLNNSANTHNIIYRSGTSTFIAGGDKLVVQDGGNVGIGTTSPDSKLEVSGTFKSTGWSYLAFDGPTSIVHMGSENSTATQLNITTSDTGSSTISATNELGVNVDNSTRIKIKNNGNVGIGTTNPSQLLHVAGNMRLQNQLYDSTNSLGSNGEVLTKVSAGTEWKAPAVNAQIPDNTAPASAANVGTIRYRSTSNTSFVDMSMQTGATTYTWVNIVSNFW